MSATHPNYTAEEWQALAERRYNRIEELEAERAQLLEAIWTHRKRTTTGAARASWPQRVMGDEELYAVMDEIEVARRREP